MCAAGTGRPTVLFLWAQKTRNGAFLHFLQSSGAFLLFYKKFWGPSWCLKNWPCPKFSYIMTTWQMSWKYATWFLRRSWGHAQKYNRLFQNSPGAKHHCSELTFAFALQHAIFQNSPFFKIPFIRERPPFLHKRKENNQTKQLNSITAGHLVVSARPWGRMPGCG